jgi:HSP20 family molecular chaperone IbpA
MTGLKQFGESAANAVLERIGRGIGRVQERKPLAYDLLESDDAYLVVFDAPGATRSDVQVRFLEGEVQVRIDRFRDFYEEFEMRFPGRGLSLDGRAELPDDAVVDARDATATLTSSGSLRVEIPKGGAETTVEVTEESEASAGAEPESTSEGGDEPESETASESAPRPDDDLDDIDA